MEEAACNVLYVDRAAREERLVRRGDKPLKALGATEETRLVDGQTKLDEAERTLYTNVETLLETFSAGACERENEPLTPAPREAIANLVFLFRCCSIFVPVRE